MHPPVSDDAVLLEHLQLANQQLRTVLAGAGCNLPELPLPTHLQRLQEEEVMALLAEENYQLRQLLQQLQHQQQLEELEQQYQLQQELELNRNALEFDRLSPSPEQPHGCSPLAPGSEQATPQCGSPSAPGSSRGWASPAHAAPGAVLSPAAARLVGAPSLNTVQLVEGEAAAQLATQAAIQAEAEAHQHMPWHVLQQPLQDSYNLYGADQTRSAGPVTAARHEEAPTSSLGFGYDQQRQQRCDGRMMEGPWLAERQHISQPQPATAALQQQHQQPQPQQLAPQFSGGSGRLALPQLPRLMLPRSVTGRRSQESTCSDVGRSPVYSAASGDLTWRSHATGGTSSQQPASATAAASARSNASSSCSGLKQLTNDLLLLPSSLRSSAATGPDALQQTFGEADAAGAVCADYANGARLFGVGHAGAAAGMAADAAAGIWYPAAGGAAAGANGSDTQQASAVAGATSGEHAGGVMSPHSRAADVATDAVRGIVCPGALFVDQLSTAQQQQHTGSCTGSSAAQPPPASKPGLRLPPSVFAGATNAAHAAAADMGDLFSSDQWQQQQLEQHQQVRNHLQQQQQLSAGGSDLRLQLPALPPIATTARRGPGAAHSGAAAASQAAAAAAVLAGQSFCMQPQPQTQQQQQQQLPGLRLPPRVQTFQQQHGERRSSSFDSSLSDVPASLPKLRLPAPRQTAASEAGGGAAGTELQQQGLALPQLRTQTEADCDSSLWESPCSDSAFFRAADSGLFEGGDNGLFEGVSDLFGARISMDDSRRRISACYSEAQPSQLPEVPEDYFGLPDSAGSGEGGEGISYCNSQQSGWLGISYQQQSLRGGQFGGLSSAQGSRELFQPLYAGGASAEDGSYGAFRRRGLGQSLTAGDTIDELPELQHEALGSTLSRQDTRGSAWDGSGFVATAAAGSMSSLTSGVMSHQVSAQGGMSAQPSAAAHDAGAAAQGNAQQEQLPAFPNLAPLRVLTGRQQQDQTPPLTWQPQPLRTDSSSSARSNTSRAPSAAAAAAAAFAATSPAHMAATEAAEAAASVGLAAAAAGGMDSLQLQQLLNHLARVAEEANTTVTAAVGASAAPVAGRTASAPAGPTASIADVCQLTGGTPSSARACAQHSQQDQEQQGEQQQCAAADAADAECFTPVGRSGDQAGAAGQSARPLSPFAAAGMHSPAREGPGGCLVMSPKPPALQRTLSAGQVGPAAAGLPPKWASRSGSSSNLTALGSQVQQAPSPKRQLQPAEADDTASHVQADQQVQSPAAAMRAVPDRAATAPAPPASLISPRLGLHGRLRVITHTAAAVGGGYSSNGSNSDAEAGSTHTTPMHRPPAGAGVLRTNSGSSFRPAGLASITVPPSPASSGVRYMPASPRVVGFDCPLTPHAYALRSPSWRSEVGGIEGSSMGGHSGTLACGSGNSTPRRQASSPGLLQQALARSGFAPQQHHSQPQLGYAGAASAAGSGSGCNTPSSAASAARRAASTGQVAALGNGSSVFAAAAHAAPVAAPGSDKLPIGSHGSSVQLKPAGSCSSSALLVAMMGGTVPMLHHRTASQPHLEGLQSPGSARKMRSSTTGFEATAEEAHAAREAAAAALPLPDPGLVPVQAGSSSNAGSRRSSNDSGSSSSGEEQGAAGPSLSAAGPASDAAAGAAPDDATVAEAGIDVAPELLRSVSPQLTVATRSRSVSPQLQQVTSPPAHSAQACAEVGQHKLSRFGLAAARASTEKPLLGVSGKGAEIPEGVVPEQGLTAVIMTVGQSVKAGVPEKADLGWCDDSNRNGSSSSQDQACGQHQAAGPAAAGPGAAVAVPDTPALDTASEAAAFAAQQSLEQEEPAVASEAFSSAALIEQELQRAAAEEAAAAAAGPAAPAAAAATCSTGPGHVSSNMAAPSSSNGPGADRASSSSSGAGASMSRPAQHVAWSADSTCAADGGCEHHAPPASPCTPQQDAEQQQQQQLQSPERQQDQHHTWTPAQQHAPAAGGCASPSTGCMLPRSKSAAYLAGNASAAAAAARAVSDTGTPTADSAGAGAAPGMWSPTHHVRSSGRHRSPSALLMRLSQKQVEVLMARGRASNAVSYVLPHRSSNPASALRALTTGNSADCSSSQCPDQSCAGAPAGSTPRSSLDICSSASTPHGQHGLQAEASWEIEQLHPPEDLLAVASTAMAASTEYVPVPRGDSIAPGETRQQQQRPQLQADGACGDVVDNRDVLLSAAIVQQRLKNSSMWLGPAPVVAASAAAAEAEAAAVVTRRRSWQQEGSATSSRSSSSIAQDGSSGSGRVASAAAALAASADGVSVAGGAELQRASSSGGSGSRVAAAAAALSASGTGPTAGSGGTPGKVAAKLRPVDAWLAVAGAAGGAKEPVVQRKTRQGSSSQVQQVPGERIWQQQAGAEAEAAAAAGSSCTSDAAASGAVGCIKESAPAGGSAQEPTGAAADCCAEQQQGQHQQQQQQDRVMVSGDAASAVCAEPAVESQAATAAASHRQQRADGASTGTASAAVPAAQQAGATEGGCLRPKEPACMPAAATAAGQVGSFSEASAPGAEKIIPACDQLLQLEQTDGDALSAVRSRQQQLLKQRQLMRQQLRKRQEVAAWALTQGQQHPAAALPATAGAGSSQDVQQVSLDQAAAAVGAVAAVGVRLAKDESGRAAATNQQQVLSAAEAADIAAAAAQATDGFEHEPAELGYGGVGLQRCDSMALSVADSFEGQSWAAWSTTSSINRCPKLQWWGNESGQGRFSQRQQQQRRQGLRGGANSSEAGWWQRLLQGRQEGSGMGGEGASSAAGPSVGPQ